VTVGLSALVQSHVARVSLDRRKSCPGRAPSDGILKRVELQPAVTLKCFGYATSAAS
jgi:hypothetical protein